MLRRQPGKNFPGDNTMSVIDSMPTEAQKQRNDVPDYTPYEVIPGKPGRLPEISVGEMLVEEFLKPGGVSQYRLARDSGLSESHISEIISGKRGITAATALRFGAYFGNSAEFWLNLQNRVDLKKAEAALGDEIARIPRWQPKTPLADEE
jgi:antitoxin HigA-1